jgi:hypothetical protein
MQEFPSIVSGVGLMAQGLMDRIIRDMDGPYEDQYIERWREIGKLQAEYGYFHAAPIERLHIEHIVLSYLQLVQAQDDYQSALTEDEGTGGLLTAFERRLNAVQMRYLRAVESLARIRRLALPMPLQINIGGPQVNVAGGTGPATSAGEAPIIDVSEAAPPMPAVQEPAMPILSAGQEPTSPIGSNGTGGAARSGEYPARRRRERRPESRPRRIPQSG